jgi:hypothetical protein
MVILKALCRDGFRSKKNIVSGLPRRGEEKQTKGEAANDQAASGDLACAIVRGKQSDRNLSAVTNFAVGCGQSSIVHSCSLL